MAKIKEKWKLILLCIMAIVSMILLFNQPIKEALIHSFKPEISATSLQKDDKGQGKYEYGQVKRLTMSNIAAARANAKNIRIIGVICIPKENLTLPISKGITNQNLALSAGTFREDMKMGQGNYALAGHNMSNLGPKVLFSPLYYKGKIGQKIYITNLKTIYEYKISQKKIISKYDTGVVQNTPNKIITLITCDATGVNRLMVRGNYVKKIPYKKAPAEVQKDLSEKFNVN